MKYKFNKKNNWKEKNEYQIRVFNISSLLFKKINRLNSLDWTKLLEGLDLCPWYRSPYNNHTDTVKVVEVGVLEDENKNQRDTSDVTCLPHCPSPPPGRHQHTVLISHQIIPIPWQSCTSQHGLKIMWFTIILGGTSRDATAIELHMKKICSLWNRVTNN